MPFDKLPKFPSRGIRRLGSWRKTAESVERIRDSKFYEEPHTGEVTVGKFRGRNIISRDSPIIGGIYIGAAEREAIVVDEKYGELIKVYQELLLKRDKEIAKGVDFKDGVLKEVWELVMKKMPYNLEATQRVIAEHTHDDKFALDSFLLNKVGICRHQALLGGYLLEKLIAEGKIHGRVSVDRNYVEEKGGHAWVRYTNSNNEVFIIDPAQHYFGRLDEIDEDRWFYERPSDIEKRKTQPMKSVRSGTRGN